jgi:hypothetical protein
VCPIPFRKWTMGLQIRAGSLRADRAHGLSACLGRDPQSDARKLQSNHLWFLPRCAAVPDLKLRQRHNGSNSRAPEMCLNQLPLSALNCGQDASRDKSVQRLWGFDKAAHSASSRQQAHRHAQMFDSRVYECCASIVLPSGGPLEDPGRGSF